MSTADAPPQPAPVPLAIVGMGCLFPKADSAAAFWANIKGGVDAVGEIPSTHWRPEDYFSGDPSAPDMTYARRGAFLEPVDFNPLEFGISPNNIEATDTTQLLGMLVAQQALRDAGYATGKEGTDGKPFNRDRTSVILGVTGALELVIPLGARLGHPIWRKALKDAGVDANVADDVVKRIGDGYVPWQENSFPGLLGNVAAGRIANRFDVGGTNCVVDAACASSLGALHVAAMELYAGRSDVAITGGIDTFNDIFMYMCFSKTPALSPTGNSRPFSAGGDGTILGEGLGVVVLKRLADAVRDGDNIRAIIRSIGSSSDGKGNAVYAPSADGQVRCLMSAYQQAGVSPGTIELVEAHGTGTKVGDAVEAKALAEVFRTDKADGTWCALGSVKSMVGHTKAAAGIAGLIKAALALEHKVLPPTIKVDRPLEPIEPGKAPVYVNAEPRPWLPRADHPRRAGVSAFGFGGSNFHCLLEEAAAEKTSADWDDSVLLLPISAESPRELSDALRALEGGLDWKHLRAESHRLRGVFRTAAAYRLLLVAEKGHGTDVAKLVRGATHMLERHADRTAWNTPDGAFFASGKPTGKLGVIFPGQGSQYVGMLRDLACQFPQFLSILTSADAAFGVMKHGGRLSDRVYPISKFTADAKAADERALSDTRVAQPALGAVSLAAWGVLESFGVRPDATAGHSFGELVALCAAGRVDGPALHRLAVVRGRAMAGEDGGAPADRGAMLAAAAPAADLRALLAAEKLDLILANKNGPDQVVLSGATAEIDRAAGLLHARGVRCRRLAVSAAFHSPFVAAAARPFAAALDEIAVAPGRCPVYANTTAAAYPADAAQARAVLARQIAEPVEFVAEIEAMHDAGVRTFLEVGPGNKMAGLVRAILAGREHQVVSLDASAGKRPGVYDLGCALAQLAAAGYPVDVKAWDAGFTPPVLATTKKPAVLIRLSGANYVKPRPAREPSPVAVARPPQPPSLIEKGSSRLNPTPPPSSLPSSPPARLAVPTDPYGTKRDAESTGDTPGSARPAQPSPHLMQALETTQQSLLALQKMQEQTAHLHQQYLHGQELAQHTIHQLVDQQMRLLASACGVALPGSSVVPVAVAAPTAPAFAAPLAYAAPPVAPAPAPVRERSVAPELSPARIEVPQAPAIHSGNGNGSKRAAAPVVATPAPLIPSPVAPAADSATQTVLLEVVADKTGYPVEMLELDMSLDSDLGIDSIKRVEILSALQMRLPDAPVVKPEDLGRIQTLRQIVEFLTRNAPAPTAAVAVAPAAPALSADAGDETQTALLEVVSDKTGYPVEMLELDMSLDSDLGIDSIKRVEILSALQIRLPEAPIVKPDDLGRLQTLRQIIGFLQQPFGTPSPLARAATDVHAGAAPATVTGKTAGTRRELADSCLDRRVLTLVPLDPGAARPRVNLPAGAAVWVTDDGDGLAAEVCRALASRHVDAKVVSLEATRPDAIAGLLILAPAAPGPNFIKTAFALIQRVAPALREAGRRAGAFLASASRLDGSFALNGHAPASALTGGLAGLVKTASHEWPEVSCKSLDVSPDPAASPALASQIAEELLLVGPAEVGLADGGRCEPKLVLAPLNGEVGQSSLVAGDVVVVTGGARGVTAAVSVAVAETYGCNLLLLGRSPAPMPEPDWLVGVTGETQIKKAIVAKYGGLSPRALEERYRRAVINREMLATLKRIEAAGVKATYRSLDVRDELAVVAAVDEAREQLGPIGGIVHGAGVLQDRLIEEKTAEQFEEVYATKVDGFLALLDAVRGDELKAIVAFSSSTGRFGRRGQVAYAAANEVLNKLAQQEARRRPGCRVLSINWGPWEGGMVTPALRRIFENEGVGLIPLEAGANYLMRELATPSGGPVEIVILGTSRSQDAWSAPAPSVAVQTDGPLAVVFRREVDVPSFPVLRSHVIKGRAVVPMALILEWLAHGAMLENPGMVFHGVDDLRVFKGVVLTGDAPISIQVLAGPPTARGGMEVIPVELRSGATLHARATVVLAPSLPAARPAEFPSVPNQYPAAPDELYEDGRLFHGEALRAIRSIAGWSEEGIVADVATAPVPSAWMKHPVRSAWLADPLALDAAFQLMILWCFESRGIGSLPTRAARYRQYRAAFPAGGVRVAVHATAVGEHAAEAVIEFVDEDGALVARIDGYECVMDATLKDSFAVNEL